MIKLKNGKEIKYNEDFDIFFMNLLETIINESKKIIYENPQNSNANESDNDILVKEIMDNCIYVTHQLFELSKTNKDLAKFLVTGFVFNSVMITLSLSNKTNSQTDDDTVH